jgi:Tfp pilus assembly protein PilO
MSQSSAKLAAGRARVRAQFAQMRKSRRHGMFGFGEIIGVAVAGLAVLIAIGSYFYFMSPAQSRVKALLMERDRLQRELRLSAASLGRETDTKAKVEKITDSLDRFETSDLVGREGGRMQLYEEINKLIHSNSLRNTSGPTYTTLEPLGSKAAEAAATKSAATKWQSIYPGIAVNVTVEGPYQNVRHFVRDIETSKQFIIINAVELERATETNNLPAESDVKSATNRLVSLRLDLATYFQRLDRQEDKKSAEVH